MKLTYDPNYNVAYLSLQEKRAEVESIRLSDDVVLDLGPDGTLYGIELLNANQQLGGKDRVFSVINEASGNVAELELPA